MIVSRCYYKSSKKLGKLRISNIHIQADPHKAIFGISQEAIMGIDSRLGPRKFFQEGQLFWSFSAGQRIPEVGDPHWSSVLSG